MSRRTSAILSGVLSAVAIVSSGFVQGAEPVFEKDIAPLLAAKCGQCHGKGKLEGGLDLRRRFLILNGGDSGAAIVPGKPDESVLVQRVAAGEMPPDKKDRLEPAQIELLKQWIAAGAKTSTETEPLLPDGQLNSRITQQDRAFWSFKPPVRSAVPNVTHTDRVRTPIDAFLLQALEARQLCFNVEASKSVLLRRLTFDLLGLPPSIEQLDEFLADDSSEAYERLVDRLLDSPHYGERWGRHWLDVAGYADSDGYLAADRVRPEAWRYRDYVIRALNADLPYDQFVIEQLAGDELTDWRRSESLAPQIVEQLIATGFLRTALDPTYPGYTEPNEIHQVLADTMQIVGSTFLGLTIQCARCHDHKQDPISQREYYSLQAAFIASFDPARWQPSEVRGVPMASESEEARITTANRQADAQIAALTAKLNELTQATRLRRVSEAAPTLDAATIDKLIAALLVAADKRNDEQKQLVAAHAVKVSLTEADLETFSTEYRDQSASLKAEIAAQQSLKRPIVKLRGLMELDDKPATGRILKRGDYNKPGAPVAVGVPEVLTPMGFKLELQPLYKSSGRRTALAKWLTDPSHPLLARVQVNRVWAKHFGTGLVPTLANFGKAGVAPSHPELLDWLATEFIRLGWSQKALHRLIVTSTAYRQTSEISSEQRERDPRNLFLSAFPPRRHDGEVVRDMLLIAAGQSNAQMFGAPVPVHLQGDGSVITGDDISSHRRSIYLQVRRSQHLTLLDLFDVPLMEVNCPERPTSTVPLQALALLHSPVSDRAATSLGERIVRSASNDPDRIRFAFRTLVAREPSASEFSLLTRFVSEFSQEQLASKPNSTDTDRAAALQAAWKQAALVLLNTNEFLYVD